MDGETKAAIARLELAIDSLAGMVAGCAAYLAALDEARHVDKRKALGVSRRLVPDGLSGNAMHSPRRDSPGHDRADGWISRASSQQVKTRAQDQESQDRRPLSRDWQGRPRELNPMLGKRR